MRKLLKLYHGISDLLNNIFKVILSISHFVFKPISEESNDGDNTDVLAFINFFNETFGYFHIDFLPLDYLNAVDFVKSNLSYLLIYLHGDNHEDSDKFCRDILCSTEVVEYFEIRKNSLLFWSVNIGSAEGCRVSKLFREHSYPFIGFITIGSNGRMYLMRRYEGFMSKDAFLEFIESSIKEYGITVQQFKRNGVDRNGRVNGICRGRPAPYLTIFEEWRQHIHTHQIPYHYQEDELNKCIQIRAILPTDEDLSPPHKYIIFHQSDSIKLIFYWLLTLTCHPIKTCTPFSVFYYTQSTPIQLECTPSTFEKPGELIRSSRSQYDDPPAFQQLGIEGGSRIRLLVSLE